MYLAFRMEGLGRGRSDGAATRVQLQEKGAWFRGPCP